MDLALDLSDAQGLRVGLQTALRDAVIDGRLDAGTPLPSTRALAADLGVARATVVGAYEQLVAEGYLVGRQGARTIVADVHAGVPRTTARESTSRPPVFTDLLPGEPDHASFPRTMWLASVREALTGDPDSTFAYGDHRGLEVLRVELARYLARTRAVVTDPDRIVICPGYSSALTLLAGALKLAGVDTVAVENPSLPRHADAIGASGHTIMPTRVDRDGVRVDELDGAGALVCTPTHQYPMGAALAPERRAALVAWARESDAWVIEDDYDGEFRYDRRPVGALQGLAPERVVYAGTASKSLAPGLALAWMVLPAGLADPVMEVKRLLRPGVSTIEQAALARFIASGRLDRHVRRMRILYRRRRDRLLRVLTPHFEVVGIAAGLHLTALTENEAELIARAGARSVALFGTRDHVVRGAAADRVEHGLVIGYSRSAEHGFDAALDRLSRLFD